MVVEPDERGQGYGRALVEALLDRAAEAATSACLLTTTAEEFFAGMGFEFIDRDRAPRTVRATAYFIGSVTSSYRRLQYSSEETR